jgi:succinate dehydrogenase / fumarate reductase membrane anchor subunit
MNTSKKESQNFQTPEHKAQGDGSAHEGVHHWMNQRLSAVALLPLGVFLLGWLKVYAGEPYSVLIHSLSNPWVASALFLFVATASYHGALGLQVIIEDYVPTLGWRYGLLIQAKFMMIVLPLLSLFFLMKIMSLG